MFSQFKDSFKLVTKALDVSAHCDVNLLFIKQLPLLIDPREGLFQSVGQLRCTIANN